MISSIVDKLRTASPCKKKIKYDIIVPKTKTVGPVTFTFRSYYRSLCEYYKNITKKTLK